jgi:hypothetical protein
VWQKFRLLTKDNWRKANHLRKKIMPAARVHLLLNETDNADVAIISNFVADVETRVGLPRITKVLTTYLEREAMAAIFGVNVSNPNLQNNKCPEASSF